MRKTPFIAACVMASTIAVAPAAASSVSARSCQTTVTITHNRTETVLTVNTNTCNRLVWPWGVFNDPSGPVQHDGVGIKHGQSVAYDPQSSSNVYGGWKWNNNGPVHVITTY